MSKVSKAENGEQEQEQSTIHGDILESIVTRVPLIDLLSTFQVSISWNRAVLTSLHRFNRIKPWLILHTQATRSPYSTAAHAYDPRSDVWVQVQQPPISYISALRSSHSTLLYMLSPSNFSFSFDPMHLMWHNVDAPLVWRTDPVVAVVGHRVVVAGGTCDFEDDPLAVEIYDMKTRSWDTCESMPAFFKDSASSMWLSTAVQGNKMYVVVKSTGVAYWFDPEAKSWSGPYSLCPDTNVSCCCIGFANGRLILTGLTGDNEGTVSSVRLWELNSESMELCKEMGEMPSLLVEKLRGEILSTVVNVMGDFVFVISTSALDEVLLCELGGACNSWSSVRNAVVNDKCRLSQRLVFTCANVGLVDLHRATAANGRRFSIVESMGE
ncbi:F-box/kelch-repeat protein At1g23390 [Ricinus communis]|uniref:F-box/kelch-repeat protein At1g23390 n=1 Tax=Ricinus communis TaxID=3988 RepID=UPI00201A812D|nr:F-box/kelch-repeat protein At1g23390 [Ricinus communis]